MAKQNPLITDQPFVAVGSFGETVWAVTKWRRGENGGIIAHTKFDVTSSFAKTAEDLGYVKAETSEDAA